MTQENVLVSTLLLLRRLYVVAEIDSSGNIIIPHNEYPDFYKAILREIAKIEEVWYHSLNGGENNEEVTNDT